MSELISTPGSHITLVAHSKAVQVSLDAAELLAKEDIDCEVRILSLNIYSSLVFLFLFPSCQELLFDVEPLC